ncbi:MAG TPA: ABC transporter permease [Dongiaceae bacterium]|jgi:ABC-2 type transport system permease protein|nr:ABC transporter permease [Dongiaceae bacterium]
MRVRQFGFFNGTGFVTLYIKEVRRFINVATQTILAPMITALLFLAVFALALGRAPLANGVSYGSFLAPGLIMMVMTQNAFANNSSSLLISKIQGSIVDLLMPPLSAFETLLALALAGLTRGLVVGLSTALAMSLFVPLAFPHPAFIVFHACAASLLLSLLGIIGGIWAEKFDHLAAVTNFVITPLAFLSGTFYSIARLPDFWHRVAHANPFFYMIDGFRYGFTGLNDGSLPAGVIVLSAVNLVLFGLCLVLFSRGYKLKA